MEVTCVAFDSAATLILQAHQKPNHPKLVAIVAYYPPVIPSVNTKYPPGIRVLVHLAGAEVGVQRQTEVLGIQGKVKTTQKKLSPGPGYGEPLALSFQAYSYTGAEPGFAECDLDEYDPVAERLAFTRSLTTLRRAFRIEPTTLEALRDDLVDFEASGRVDKALAHIRPYAHVINGPTLTGGVGTKGLDNFYRSFFQPLPPTFRARLLSRTVGTDRICDEVFIAFTHSQEIPWILPGIPATGKKVEVVLVSIVRIVGAKLESEHVYWDQASVLVQVGLLSAKMVPEGWKKKGVKGLPIVGAESARAMKRGSSKRLNELTEGRE